MGKQVTIIPAQVGYKVIRPVSHNSWLEEGDIIAWMVEVDFNEETGESDAWPYPITETGTHRYGDYGIQMPCGRVISGDTGDFKDAEAFGKYHGVEK